MVSIRDLLKEYGKPYSEILGINLRSRKNSEIVKWFLASLLYAKPIQESCATRTYREFERRRVVTAKKIVDTGWDDLVEILDAGSYTRYDFSTATKLLSVFSALLKKYRGNLNVLYQRSSDSQDIEKRLMGLGKGIGPATVSIFLRDMQKTWRRAEPKPTPLMRIAMKKLGIKDIRSFTKKNKLDIVRLETALFRYGKELRSKKRKK
ncbi:MAG: hypothetical protein ACE5J7_01975 [Candidatus Aenigmatarchaeota archaeon]